MSKITTFSALTIPEARSFLLRAALREGYVQNIQRGSYEGEQTRYQLPLVSGIIEKPLFDMVPVPPSQDWVPEQTVDACEEYYLNYILMGGEKKAHEEYTYADRIARNDQLVHVIDMLSATPSTNQAVITVAAPEDVVIQYPACLRELHFKFFEEQLHMYTIWRSHDLYGGFGMNIVGLAMLLRDVASFANLQPGRVYYVSTGSHIYDMVKDIIG